MLKDMPKQKSWRDHPLNVTLATIAVIIGVVGSTITIWQYFNPKSAEGLTKVIFENSFLSGKNEPAANNSQTEKRPSGKEQGKVAIVKATADGYLNLRASPTTDGEVLESAFRGDKVIILEYGVEWSKVRFKDKIGYMASAFLIVE